MPEASLLPNHTKSPGFGEWIKDPFVWVLLGSGFVFLHSGMFQLFPPPGWVDAGIYLGYGIQFPELVDRFGLAGNTYHATRLPYVLPLYVSHLVFGHLAGHLVQETGWYLLGIAAASLLGFFRGGRQSSIVAGAFLAFNPIYIATVTLSGITGATLALALVGAAAAFSPAGLRGEKLSMAVAGVFSALALATHLFFFVPLVSMAIAYRISAKNSQLPPDRKHYRVFWTAFSASILVLVLGTFTLKMGFAPATSQLLAVGSSLKGVGGAYRLPWEQWGTPYRLLVPLLLILWISTSTRGERQPQTLATNIALTVIPLAVMVAYDLFIPGTTIQYWFYFSLLIPGWVVSVATSQFFASRVSRGTIPFVVFLAVPATFIALVPGGLNVFDGFGAGTRNLVLIGAIGVGFIALFKYAAINKNRYAETVGYWGVFVLIMSCLSANSDTQRVYRSATGLDYQEAFLGAVEFSLAVERSGLAREKPRFVFDRDKLNGALGVKSVYLLRFRDQVFALNYFDTLSSLYLWDKSMLSIKEPGTDFSSMKTMEAPIRLALVGQSADEVSDLATRLTRSGYEIRSEKNASFEGNQFRWFASFVTVMPTVNRQ